MNTEINKIAGCLLIELRNTKFLKLDYVAYVTGLHKSKICKIENGNQNLDLTTLYKLCKLYNITPSDFWVKLNEQLDKKLPPPPPIKIKLKNNYLHSIPISACAY